MNSLQLGSFKLEMSKMMPKTFSGHMKKTQKHTITESLCFTEDTRSAKEESRRKIVRRPLGPT